MSAFSRGFFTHRQCPILKDILRPKNLQLSRSFSSSTIANAVKKTRSTPSVKGVLPKNKPSYTPTKSSISITPTIYQTLAATLAQKSRATILYQAPSHTTFMVSSYAAGVFCIAWAGISFQTNYVHAPADIAWWVPVAFGGVSFAMAAFGARMILGPAGIIKTVSALPRSTSRAVEAMSSHAIKANQPELQIEVECRKMFPTPFFPARKVYVKPEEVILPSPLAPIEKRSSIAEIRLQRQQQAAAKQTELEYERSHIMSAGIRHMSRAFFYIFKGIGRAWSREGFMKVNIKGKTYKLDVTGGWALDGGRALDRLVTIKQRL